MGNTKAVFFIVVFATFITIALTGSPAMADLFKDKAATTPREVLEILKKGNQRFTTGKAIHPNTEGARLIQAGREDQADHAYATVIACSDSRVPVERIFDSGVMDLFVVRVAGNVCDTAQVGSIEYGLLHVNTPVLVVLGHTKCGAVTAATKEVMGDGHHDLENNIPPLLDKIEPAVKRTMAANPKASQKEIIDLSIEENVWQNIEDIFRKSPPIHNEYKNGKLIIVGAVYDIGTGRIKWLPESKVAQIHKKVGAESDGNEKQ